MLALTVVSCGYLRWWPYHGAWVLVPMAMALLAAAAIYLTQRARYRQQGIGIAVERVQADVWSVIWMTVLIVAMAGSVLTIMAFQHLAG